MAAKEESVVVGETILGRFRLLERIGAGGFGTVYRGRDGRLERAVAVKVIEAPRGAGRRVLREAQAAARLNHPGIVTLYELGEAGGRAYLVSELVEGATLYELAGEGALSDRDVVELGADLCDALGHAHAHGVVHRDIKPQNVIVRDTDEPAPAGTVRAKLMDFGTACLVDGPGLTATGEVIGTIAYMAPEQAEGAEVGPAADVYALALTLYECLSGENPFARGAPAATARAIGEPAPPLSSHRSELPTELCELIDACLAPQPERRPPLGELGAGLARAAPEVSAEHRAPPRRWPGRIGSPSPPVAAAVRVAMLLVVSALIAWLGVIAGHPGTALVAGVLLLPALLLLPSPLHWGLPAIAPLLGAIAIAPAYPALASLAATPARRALLALLGWAWHVAAEAILGSRLLFETAPPAPAGWSDSIAEAGSGVLLPILAPKSVLVALVWAAAAVVLGALIRGRMVALELIAVLLWAAGVVALHGALADGAPEPAAGPLAATVIAVALAALWARSTGRLRSGPDVGHAPPLP